MNSEDLKNLAVLRAMDGDARSRLAASLEEKRSAEGETVFAEGDPGDSMYFILEGRIRIAKQAAAGAAPKTLTELEAGDYFGEMALLDQKPRSAAAIAVGECRLLRFSKAAFDELQKSGNRAGTELLFAMIRTSSDRIRRLSAHLVVYDEVGKAIGDQRGLQALLDAILQQLSSATAADWAILVLRSQFSDQWEVRSQLNVALTPDQLAVLRNGEGLLAPAIRNPQDHLVEDLAASEIFKSCEGPASETGSLLLSPITVEKQLLGFILLGGVGKGQFDLNALNLTRGVARQAGQAILSARHREEEEARSRHSRQFVRF
jgi:CRP-like cAMP-binding protein